MPKQAGRKQQQRRAVPYQLRSTAVTSAADMAISVMSPLGTTGWDPMSQQQQYHHMPQRHWPSTQAQTQYAHYTQQAISGNSYQAVPASLSVAPAVQHAQPYPPHVSNSQVHTNSGPWTAEMDEMLVETQGRLKWDVIAERYFHGTKTGNACRKRWARVMAERREPSRWNASRVQKVVDAYNAEGVREKIWKDLADATKEKWQDIERLCFGQGYRTMVKKDSHTHSRHRSRASSSHKSYRSVGSSSNREEDSVNADEGNLDDSGIDLVDYQQCSIPGPEYHQDTATYHGRSDEEVRQEYYRT